MSEPSHKGRYILFGYGFAILVVVALMIQHADVLKFAYENPESARETIAAFGFFGPLLLIIAQVFQVIIFFIPGPAITVVGGYAFGPFWGFVYSFIGIYAGSLIVFGIGRRYGRPFVERFVRSSDLVMYDKFIAKRGVLALLISRTAPIIVPNDVLSLAASVSKMTWREYAIVSFIGFIPNILLATLFGDRITEGFTSAGLILLFIIGISSIIYLLWHPVKEVVRVKNSDE